MSYRDGEILGVDVNGALIQWNAEIGAAYNCGEALIDFGTENATEVELARIRSGRSAPPCPNDHVVIMGKYLAEWDFASIPTHDAYIEFFNHLCDAVAIGMKNGTITLQQEDEPVASTLWQAFGSKFMIDFEHAKQAMLMRLELETPALVEGTEYKKLRNFQIYYSNWDADDIGWVVETPNGPRLVLQSHGGQYFAHVQDMNALIKHQHREAAEEMLEVGEKFDTVFFDNMIAALQAATDFVKASSKEISQ